MTNAISMDQIKALRDRTGISVMQCKKALEDAGGDEEKALVFLQQKGADVAAKKSDRELTAGSVAAYVHANSLIGAMVLLSSETDFVSNNAEFKKLAYDIAMHISATDPLVTSASEINDAHKAQATEVVIAEGEVAAGDVDAKVTEYLNDKVLLDQPYIKNPELTIRQMIETATQKFGEKIEVTKFARFAVGQ